MKSEEVKKEVLYNHRNIQLEETLTELCSTDFVLLSKEIKELKKYSRKEAKANIDWYIAVLLKSTLNVYSFNYDYSKACLFFLIKHNIVTIANEYYLATIEKILKLEIINKRIHKDISNDSLEIKYRNERNGKLTKDKKAKINNVVKTKNTIFRPKLSVKLKLKI